MSLDLKILTALRSSPAGVSGAELALRLGVTRAAVWARVEALRQGGYVIEATPHRGYHLTEAPDTLHADDLLARLGTTRVIGRALQVFEQTASTNDLVERLAQDGAPEGLAVLAETQTRGRGRLGRAWSSPPRQGLWFSVLLRPGGAPQAVTRLTVMAAVAVRRAIRAVTGLAGGIKWPNDLQLNGHKFAGILTEMSAELDRVRHVVLGIGLDVNQTLEELPAELHKVATSLRIESGRKWDRAELAVAVLRELDGHYTRLLRGEFEVIADEWESACTTIGREVNIHIGDRRLSGRAESLDPDGALLVRTEYGHLERVIGGDVTVER
jgi:BirA family transcriptional regulator, biotin operon repressor / biotin---[acetyl-CoA-carboxylase] ligase